ncbi:hypothetical protein [Staphylococcus hyicus]|uniref:hypothetical protein n=1 Tax=Staphylococcus hyicus TaxID=1284 RepID=UPI003132FD27
MTNKPLKNLRINAETYEKLKEIKFYTDQSFVDITHNAVDRYHDRLKKDGKLRK